MSKVLLCRPLLLAALLLSPWANAAEQAADYVKQLKKDKRYQRDVY